MKPEQILEHRRTALEAFVLLTVAYIFILFYKSKNPYSFLGIENRTLFALTVLGIFVLLLYIPFGKTKEKLEFIIQKYNKYKKFRIKGFALKCPAQTIKDRYIEHIKIEKSPAEYFSLAVGVIFQVLLVIFLLLLLMQQIISKIPVNLNYVLVAVIIFGIINVLVSREEEVKREPASKKDYILAGVMGIAGGIIVWYKIQNIGSLSYVISAISGILIILLSILILQEEE